MKSKLTAIVFLFLLFTVPVGYFLVPDREVSEAERRNLAQYSHPTAESIWSGSWLTETEKYLLDQFPLRDTARDTENLWNTYLLQRLDNDGYYTENGSIAKILYPYSSSSAQKFIDKVNKLYEEHLQGMNVYCCIIPDKGWYLSSQSIRPTLDFAQMEKDVSQNLNPQIAYFSVENCLNAESYYLTDLHWKQEELGAVVDKMGKIMGFEKNISDMQANELFGFRGAYASQALLGQQLDTLIYLEDRDTQAAEVSVYGKPEINDVYQPEFFTHIDPYDVFLSGANPFITITNPLASSEKELVIFRDSFSSSLAPLLISEYRTITLIDLRYMSSVLLNDYITFKDQDILFLYGAEVVNNSDILR